MRLVLCDDNRILCEALGTALESRGHHMLATAPSAALGIAAVATHRPDACLLDLVFPEPPDGLEAARVIRQICPETAVLVLSGVVDPAALSEAVRIGVSGFLRKDHDVDYLAGALDVIAAGGVAFEPPWRHPAVARPRRGRPAYVLTPREREVLRRISAGQYTGQMCREMDISEYTLRAYVKSVLAKLSAHSRLQAVAVAAREHLLDDPES
jgi:two-component system, NarL family, nitrate/nitrite response regulator NarL